MTKTHLWIRRFSLLAVLIAPCSFALESFPLNAVKITDGPFFNAQQTNKQYLLALDTEKLLAPFRREAGLPFKETYGNWESTGLDGHIGGHYISALALLYASTQDAAIKQKLDYVIAELKKCQDAVGTGYLGGLPKGNSKFLEIAKGDIRADLFATNELWVPWYNLHKTFAGLRDAYQLTGNQTARDMLIKFSEWTFQLSSKLSDEQMQLMLKTEHGGMNEIFVDVAEITGDKKYLTLAERFSHLAILNPLTQHQDQLTGLHANTQIPKVIGFKRLGDAKHDERYKDAAEFFWQTVVNNRSVAIGGNSVREHFHDTKDFSPMLEDIEGPETCNTYNMLKLSKLLFLTEQKSSYIDYYERALFNHILSSQHPTTGGLVYFTSMRPNHYRTYSQVHEGMWCCVGSGIESHSKYGEFIYARDKQADKTPEVFVNIYAASDVEWKEEGIRLKQVTNFPDETSSTIYVESAGNFNLKLRHPSWVKNGKFTVKVNGKKINHKVSAGNYLTLERQWKIGDKVSVELPMEARLEKLPDGTDFYAILYGPIVLAAKTTPFANETLNYFGDDSRMGHIAKGNLCPLEDAPFIIGNSKEFINKIKPVKGKPLTFTAKGLINGENVEGLELIPFFRLHESRYTVYWPYGSEENLTKLREQAAQAEKERLDLLARTIDAVQPGQQQPESDHFFMGEQSESGLNGDKHWRHAHKWFSYQLNNLKGEKAELQLTFATVDNGREFSIYADDQLIADVKLEPAATPFFTKTYAIPDSITRNKTFRVKFVAKEGSVAGGLYGVTLLRK